MLRTTTQTAPGFGPPTPAIVFDLALRSEGLILCRLEAAEAHPGPCTLNAYGVEESRRLPAGGTVQCEECGRPVFVGPDTCLERVEDDLDEIDGGTHRIEDLRRSA